MSNKHRGEKLAGCWDKKAAVQRNTSSHQQLISYVIDEIAVFGGISPTSTYSVKYEQGLKQTYCCPLDSLRVFLQSLWLLYLQLGQCDCENREHHFLFTTKSV